MIVSIIQGKGGVPDRSGNLVSGLFNFAINYLKYEI